MHGHLNVKQEIFSDKRTSITISSLQPCSEVQENVYCKKKLKILSYG